LALPQLYCTIHREQLQPKIKPIKEELIKTAQAAETPHRESPVAPQSDIDRLICSKDWDCKTAVAVAKAESGLRCHATNKNTNGTIDSGLFQINSIHKAKYAGRNIFDCQTNIEVAYQIYKASNWNPWVAWWSGKFKKHL
jgi:hypothetical protein